MATNPTIIRKAPWTVEVRRELIWPKTNTEGRIIWGLGVKKSYVDNSGKRYDQAPWGASIPQNNSNNGWEETLDDIIKNNNRQNQQRESESELNNIIQTNNQQKQNNTQNNAVVVASNNNNGLRNTLPWGGNVSPPTSEFPEVPTESGTIPTPTVATMKNPVIKRTKPNEITVATPEQIPQLDENGIYDIIDSLDFKVSQGKPLTVDEYKSLNAAKRQLQNMSKPQNLAGGLDNLISQQQQKITDTKKENSEQDAADLETFTNAQESYKQTQLDELNTAQEQERKRLSFILGANGGGQGTGTIAAYNNMERNFTGKKQALEDAVQAKIDLYGSQLRKDSQATIDKFEQNVLNLQMKAAEFDVANIQELNDYNKENSKTAIEKLDKLKEFSDAVIASQTPLTEQEQAQADARAVSLVKPDGSVNNEMLNILQKTNPKIAMQALNKSVGLQQQRVTDELDAKKAAAQMDLQYKRAQINNLNEPKLQVIGYDEYSGNPIYGTYQNGVATPADLNSYNNDPTNKNTGNGVPISDAIAEALEKCKNGAQCGKFVNDVLDGVGLGRLVGDSYESKEKAIGTIGEAYSIDQIGMGSIFSYPVNGSPNGHIGIVTGKNSDGTINIMDYNYKGDQQQRERLNVNPDEIFNKGGKISQPIVNNTTVANTPAPKSSQSDPNLFPQYVNYVENGKLPVGMKEGTGKAREFQEQAFDGYIKGKSEDMKQKGFSISNPTAFTSQDPDTLKAVNKSISQVQPFIKAMDDIIKLSKDNNAPLPFTKAGRELSQKIKNAQLIAKEIYNLWVLNWPDLSLMESIIANPVWWTTRGSNMFASYPELLEKGKQTVLNNAYSQANSIGLDPINKDNNASPSTNISSDRQ